MKKFANLLKCPITGNEIIELTPERINQYKSEIKNGTLKFVTGVKVNEFFEVTLADSSLQYGYILNDGIYCLLKDLAVDLQGKGTLLNSNSEIEQIKNKNRDFYNVNGWNINKDVFSDAKYFEDLRHVTADYIKKCHERFKKYIPPTGEYLLDIASGPVQYDEYLQYHEGYKYRVCADFSVTALQRAKLKLGDKGIYLLADITNIPLQDNSIDSAISLHTIYHVPKEEQIKAMSEMYRVCKEGSNVAIIYSWGYNSILNNLGLIHLRIIRKIKAVVIWILSLFNRNIHFKEAMVTKKKRGLYFYAYSYKRLKALLPFNFEIMPWRSVSVKLTKLYIHPFLFGKRLLSSVFSLENKYPLLFARIGQYPIIIIRKRKI
jgi:ubiquinone/menaquinone biosynthesis C-methylase UbiE